MGRSQTNGLVISADRASRRHATIHAQDDGDFWLIDLGSANGTLLNGNRVFHPMRLQAGDKIDIAGHVLTFQSEPRGEESITEFDERTVTAIPQIRSELCWLVVADIEDFTRMSQKLDPETLAVSVGRWVQQSRELTEKHGGVINKYLGDGYLAFWRDQPGTAARVMTALAENQALQRAGDLRYRLVVHLGAVLFGGSASVGEESLMGPEVNFVFRMEKVAGGLALPIMLSAAAATAAAALAEVTAVEGAHELKGFDGAHRFFAFERARPLLDPLETRADSR
jgi:adenylate cyclase